MKLLRALAIPATLVSIATQAHAGSSDSLACIEQMFDDDKATAMAELGSGDEARSKAAEKKLDFMMMGMASRMCANQNHWSENQYYNSIGYLMAWPTMRGLQLLGRDSGYPAIDRAWARHAAELIKKNRLGDSDIDAIMAEASQDGLTIKDEAARKDARRYVDVLQQVAAMRDDFAANRKPRNLKK